jgi:hypothetical protein
VESREPGSGGDHRYRFDKITAAIRTLASLGLMAGCGSGI